MTFLPIAGRELAVASRRPGTYRLRGCGVLMAVLVLCVVYASRVPKGQLGQHVFDALGVATLTLCILAGLMLTAHSIAEEKEGGTIGLLFLTDLQGFDIVLGKLAAHSVSAFFILLAIFPVLAMPLLMGGVTGLEFSRLLLVCGTTLFFSLSLGLAVSAATHDPKKALGWALLWMTAATGLMPALWWLQSLSLHAWWMDFLLWPSPAFAFRHSLDAFYRVRFGAADFWRSINCLWLMAALCLAWASFVTPRAWQRQELRPRRLRSAARKPRGWGKAEAAHPFCRVTILDAGPSRLANLFVAGALPIWLCLFFMPDPVPRTPPIAFIVCLFFAMALHFIVKLLMILGSVARFNHDRDSGALELLLATPLPVKSIIEAQLKAQRARFRLALWMLILLNLALLSRVWADWQGLDIDANDRWIFSELFLGGIVALVLDFETILVVGAWHGLSKQKVHKAVMVTVAQLLGPNWLFAFFLVFVQPDVHGQLGVAALFACWFITGWVVDGVSMAGARLRLREQFRSVAAQRHDKAG